MATFRCRIAAGLLIGPAIALGAVVGVSQAAHASTVASPSISAAQEVSLKTQPYPPWVYSRWYRPLYRPYAYPLYRPFYRPFFKPYYYPFYRPFFYHY